MTLLSCKTISEALSYVYCQVALYVGVVIPKTWDLGL